MTTNNRLLFQLGQEVTPLCKKAQWGSLFGKTYHIQKAKAVNGYWYVTLAEIPPGTFGLRQYPELGSGKIIEDWWAQEGLAPVLPSADLNRLLCDVEMSTIDLKPVIILDY